MTLIPKNWRENLPNLSKRLFLIGLLLFSIICMNVGAEQNAVQGSSENLPDQICSVSTNTNDCEKKFESIIIPSGKIGVNFKVESLDPGIECDNPGVKILDRAFLIEDTATGDCIYSYYQENGKGLIEEFGSLSDLKLTPGTYLLQPNNGAGAEVSICYSLEDDSDGQTVNPSSTLSEERSSDDPRSNYYFTITPRLPYVVMVDPDAESYYAQVIENNQNNSVEPFRTIDRADYYRLLMMYSQAIAIYDQVLNADPENVYARKGKAVAVTELFNPDANNALRVNYSDDDLIDICLDAVENNEKDPYAWTTLGVANYYLGARSTGDDIQKYKGLAIQAFNNATDISSELPEPILWESLISEDTNDITRMKQLVQKYPEITEAYIQLWVLTGDRSYVEKAVENQPDQMYPWMFLGMSQSDDGDQIAALKSYIQAADVYLKSAYSVDSCDLWTFLAGAIESNGGDVPEEIITVLSDCEESGGLQ